MLRNKSCMGSAPSKVFKLSEHSWPMEKFQELRETARKKISLADHILTQTYPLLKDQKLLIAALENVFLAYTNAIGALLHHERLFKRIPAFQDTFDSKWRVFIDECAEKYGIKQEDINMIRNIKEIIVEHRKSPMEFVRNGKFVICSDDYHMKTVGYDEIKKALAHAQGFVAKISSAVSKNEGIFMKV